LKRALALFAFCFLLSFTAISVSMKPTYSLSKDPESHQCRFWAMISDNMPENTVLDHLVNMPSSLKNLGASNRDGWGLAYYNSSGTFVLRGQLPAYSDTNFNLSSHQLASSHAQVGVGHVRIRTSGATAIPDPHPFMRFKNGTWWAFGHNGGLDKTMLKNLIGQAYLDQNPPTVGDNWTDPDVVDSDLYMLYIMKRTEENCWNATLGIAKAVADIAAQDQYSGMNFFLTNGQTLWGFRRANTLCYYHNATSPQYSAIASQPPNATQPGWTQLDDYNLIVLTKDKPPTIIDNAITIPEHPSTLTLPLLAITTLLAIALSIKKTRRPNKH